jgi:pyrrolidone-carboxylate peptidase
MKLLDLMIFTIFFLTSHSAWAKETVLVSHYDAFGKAKFNNSEKIAYLLKENFKNSEIQIEICPLKTVFDKSYGELENCFKSLPQAPALVLSLGEYGCKIKAETIVRNYDFTQGPDNEGNERDGEIIPNSKAFAGLRYPLPQMYCALPKKERNFLTISNDAGSFVCNNTAYQMNQHYPDLQFGLIHVPANHCWNLDHKNKLTVKIISTMIQSAVEFLGSQFFMSPEIPHPSNELKLPILKSEISDLANSFAESNSCLYDYFKNSHGVDE